ESEAWIPERSFEVVSDHVFFVEALLPWYQSLSSNERKSAQKHVKASISVLHCDLRKSVSKSCKQNCAHFKAEIERHHQLIETRFYRYRSTG
ncbi:hypothetical protein V3C99_010393, partial [Haemonchus contortus]